MQDRLLVAAVSNQALENAYQSSVERTRFLKQAAVHEAGVGFSLITVVLASTYIAANSSAGAMFYTGMAIVPYSLYVLGLIVFIVATRITLFTAYIPANIFFVTGYFSLIYPIARFELKFFEGGPMGRLEAFRAARTLILPLIIITLCSLYSFCSSCIDV